MHVHRLEGRRDPRSKSWMLKICLHCHLFCSPMKSCNVNRLKAETPDLYLMLYLFSIFSLGVCIANSSILRRLFSLMLFSPSVGMQSTYR